MLMICGDNADDLHVLVTTGHVHNLFLIDSFHITKHR